MPVKLPVPALPQIAKTYWPVEGLLETARFILPLPETEKSVVEVCQVPLLPPWVEYRIVLPVVA